MFDSDGEFIDFRPISKRAGGWKLNFEAVREFSRAHGCLPSEYADDPSERSLSFWLTNQRSRLAGRGMPLTSDQSQLLRTIPGFTPVGRNVILSRTFAEVHAYVSEHGWIPRSRSKDVEEVRLLRWVHRQRTRILGTKPGAAALTPEQIELMCTLPGFITPSVRRTLDLQTRA